MFYLLSNNIPVESFLTEPVLHPDVMANIVESVLPIDMTNSIWNGTSFNDINSQAELDAQALLQAQEAKIVEINNYASDLIEAAYTNPVAGKTVDPVRFRKKTERFKANLLDRLAAELPILPAQKDRARLIEKLSKFEMAIDNDIDDIISVLEGLTTTEEVVAFIISAENWNIWTPSV